MIPEKSRKKIFYFMVLVTFVMVAIYQFLTPTMSDDITYGDIVSEANNFFDLFIQEYEHYMGHGGRSVAHIILRIFLFIGVKGVFNVVAALVFTFVSLLIYMNIDYRNKYDIRMYGFVACFLWLLDPSISNTVFWETGACNYLFTGAIVLSYMTFFRKHMRNNSENSVKLAIKMFLLGLVAGWCNENTSGGAILFVLILLLREWLSNNKSFKFLKNWMIAAILGNFVGFAIMILSPGNFSRASVTEEEHTGLLALGARFLKIVLNIKNNYLLLVMAFAVLLIYIAYVTLDKRKFMETTQYMRILGFVALATALSLIAVPSSELRTYYGASLFLMMAVLNEIAYVANSRVMSGSASDDARGLSWTMHQTVITSIVVMASIFLMFTYIEQGANLARIKREYDERDAYLQQMADSGEVDVYAPMLRPQWVSRFSMAYESDIQEDYNYWINNFYANHYGLDTVSGVEREEWTEY